MPMQRVVLWIFLLCFMGHFNCWAENRKPLLYATAKIPTPVLNTSDFRSVFGGKTGGDLKTDNSGLVREIEFIALPGTVFTVQAVINEDENNPLHKVTTEEYPYPARTGYCIDSRFVKLSRTKPTPRVRILPPEELIIKNLLSAVCVE